MMFCPNCGGVLDAVGLADPCPCCGGKRRSANAPAPCATGSGTVLRQTVVSHSYPGDVGEGIDVGNPRYRSSSTADPGGGRQVLDGEPSRHEQDVQHVCDNWREALAQVGGHWDRFRVYESETSDVDALAEDGYGRRRQFQVTRV